MTTYMFGHDVSPAPDESDPSISEWRQYLHDCWWETAPNPLYLTSLDYALEAQHIG